MKPKLAILLLLLTLPLLAQELETRIFQLNAAPAESAAEMVRPLLSSQGKVIPDSRLNKLIVKDTAQVLSEVENLLTEIDVHAPQVRIHVTMHGVSQTSGASAGVVISPGRRGTRVSAGAGVGSGTSRMDSQQNLLVMSGGRGVLYVGRDVVQVAPYQHFAVHLGLLPPQLLFQTVGTGFEIEPIVQGDVVRMKVTPWMSFLGSGGAQQVRVEEASSTFAVQSGQTVTIASGGYRQDIKNRAFGLIMGVGSESTSTSSRIDLRPVVTDY